MLKALKKVRFWLYEIRFTIEIDVNILITQLNRSAVDLSEILMTRWLTWIRLFDFNVRHVLDKKHIATDELFRKSCELSNDIDEVHEKNIDDFINDQLNCVRVCSMRVNENDDEQFLKNEYFEKFQRIVHYLITLTRSNHLNRKKFRKFKNWALQFLVRDKHLFKRVNKNVLLQKIIDKTENQAIILKQFHNENDYREQERIYRRVIDRYWWRNLYRDCEKYVVNYESCQLRAFNREKKTLHFIWISNLFQKINIDCVHLSQSRLMKALVVIRNDLTEWMKTRVLFNLKTKTVAKFLWKNIICRFECFESIVMNEDFENKVVTEKLLNRYRIRIKLTSTYHASINEMIKKEHRSLINVLSKLIENKIERWSQHLHAMLWTDRKYSIWHIMNWNKIRSIEDLLTIRVRQFLKKNKNLKKTVLHLKRMKKQNKKLFDDKYQLRKILLSANNLILKHNIKLNNKYDFKLTFRWNEPFRIQRANSIKNIYILKKMNKTRLERTYAGNRLKRFKIKDVEDLSTRQTEIHEMLNIAPENSINAMKKSNNINKDARIDNEVRSEVVQNTAESLNADNQIFENDATDDNLSNSKI